MLSAAMPFLMSSCFFLSSSSLTFEVSFCQLQLSSSLALSSFLFFNSASLQALSLSARPSSTFFSSPSSMLISSKPLLAATTCPPLNKRLF
ncbi:hypothetical protein FGO68_gene3033 [Halteria grandinella]|uniref:Secreted protein n=1 Tax=Halteria grandinella TaxID=5974 RepID=A0A8J8NLY8_HALGN|nr:hypothetical protein FGO68_gene3033 [Halteria grandinella]